jgi:hypothetical protein
MKDGESFAYSGVYAQYIKCAVRLNFENRQGRCCLGCDYLIR